MASKSRASTRTRICRWYRRNRTCRCANRSTRPVDFLTEDDVIDGLANDYRVIYTRTGYWTPGSQGRQAGLPIRPADRSGVDAGFSHFLPTEMNARLLDHFVRGMLPEGFSIPVVCSEPLVESTCIDSKGKLAVPLI